MDVPRQSTSDKKDKVMFTIRRTTNNEKGLFAQRDYRRGSILFSLKGGVEYEFATGDTIEVDYDIHVDHQWGKYLSHAANPNVVIVDYFVIACKDIEEGDLICSYFPQHETTLDGSLDNNYFNTVSVTLDEEGDFYIGAPA